MIAANDGGYFIKSIYNNLGFAVTKTDVFGNSVCDDNLTIKNKNVSVKSRYVGVEAIFHYFVSYNFASVANVRYIQRVCPEAEAKAISVAPISESLSNQQELAVVYPSQVTEEQTTAYLKLTSTLDNNTPAQVVIYTATGQTIVTQNIALTKGVNNIQLKTNELSKGLHLIVITTAKGVLDKVKFVKE